ncbi:MAG: hypothetical protein WCP97_00675 [bacterium]
MQNNITTTCIKLSGVFATLALIGLVECLINRTGHSVGIAIIFLLLVPDTTTTKGVAK